MQPSTPTENDKLLEVTSGENAIPSVVTTTVDFGSDPARIDVTNTNGYTVRTAVLITVYPVQAGGTFDENIKIQYLGAKGGDTFFTIYRKLTGDDSAGVTEGARVQCNVDAQWAYFLMQALYNILDKQGNPLTTATGALTPQAQAVVDKFVFSTTFQTSATAEVNVADATTTLDLAAAQALTGWVQNSSYAINANGDYYLLVRINGDLSGRMKTVDASDTETIFALGRFTLLGTVGTTKYYFLNQVGDNTMPLSHDVTNTPVQVSWQQQATTADRYNGDFTDGSIDLEALATTGTPTVGYKLTVGANNRIELVPDTPGGGGGGEADGHLTDATLDTATNSATLTVTGGTPSTVTLDLSSLSDKVPTGLSLDNNILTMTFDDGTTETVDLSALAGGTPGTSLTPNPSAAATERLKKAQVGAVVYEVGDVAPLSEAVDLTADDLDRLFVDQTDNLYTVEPQFVSAVDPTGTFTDSNPANFQGFHAFNPSPLNLPNGSSYYNTSNGHVRLLIYGDFGINRWVNGSWFQIYHKSTTFLGFFDDNDAGRLAALNKIPHDADVDAKVFIARIGTTLQRITVFTPHADSFTRYVPRPHITLPRNAPVGYIFEQTATGIKAVPKPAGPSYKGDWTATKTFSRGDTYRHPDSGLFYIIRSDITDQTVSLPAEDVTFDNNSYLFISSSHTTNLSVPSTTTNTDTKSYDRGAVIIYSDGKVFRKVLGNSPAEYANNAIPTSADWAEVGAPALADGHLTAAILDSATNSATFTITGGSPSVVTLDLDDLTDGEVSNFTIDESTNIATITLEDGSTETIDLSFLVSTAVQIRDKLAGLTGDDRLDVAAVKNALVEADLINSYKRLPAVYPENRIAYQEESYTEGTARSDTTMTAVDLGSGYIGYGAGNGRNAWNGGSLTVQDSDFLEYGIKRESNGVRIQFSVSNDAHTTGITAIVLRRAGDATRDGIVFNIPSTATIDTTADIVSYEWLEPSAINVPDRFTTANDFLFNIFQHGGVSVFTAGIQRLAGFYYRFHLQFHYISTAGGDSGDATGRLIATSSTVPTTTALVANKYSNPGLTWTLSSFATTNDVTAATISASSDIHAAIVAGNFNGFILPVDGLTDAGDGLWVVLEDNDGNVVDRKKLLYGDVLSLRAKPADDSASSTDHHLWVWYKAYNQSNSNKYSLVVTGPHNIALDADSNLTIKVYEAVVGGGTGSTANTSTDDQTAAEVSVDTSSFNRILGDDDDTVQHALETLDAHVATLAAPATLLAETAIPDPGNSVTFTEVTLTADLERGYWLQVICASNNPDGIGYILSDAIIDAHADGYSSSPSTTGAGVLGIKVHQGATFGHDTVHVVKSDEANKLWVANGRTNAMSLSIVGYKRAAGGAYSNKALATDVTAATAPGAPLEISLSTSLSLGTMIRILLRGDAGDDEIPGYGLILADDILGLAAVANAPTTINNSIAIRMSAEDQSLTGTTSCTCRVWRKNNSTIWLSETRGEYSTIDIKAIRWG